MTKLDKQREDDWKKACRKVDEKNDKIKEQKQIYQEDDRLSHMYLFLYLAETNHPTLRGVYFGENTYVVDLRKALPSTFLRPCSQHGWIVRGKREDYCYEDSIACVIRINIDLVNRMLGDGSLVSEENFFPSEEFDEGYKILLQRQEKTHIPTTHEYPKILPPNTINLVKNP